MKNPERNPRAFTLVELLLATFILMPIYLITMMVFINCSRINEMSRNQSLALAAAVNRMQAIENTDFAQIAATYHNVAFTANNINGRGVTYVNSTNPSYVIVTVVFCWKESNNRLFGEDANLNGQLNVGEDANGNGELDSPVKLVSIIYNA